MSKYEALIKRAESLTKICILAIIINFPTNENPLYWYSRVILDLLYQTQKNQHEPPAKA